MNKVLVLLLIALLSIGGVLAAGNGSESGSGSQSEDNDSEDSDDLVCCESFGYGAMMVKTESTFAMVPRSECVVPEGFVGGGKNIADDDYCETGSVERDRRILNESETREEIRARTNISRLEDDDENETEDELDDDDENETDRDGYRRYLRNNSEAVQLRNENGFGLKIGQLEANSTLRLEAENRGNGTEIRANLSNGRNAIIKIMPSTASETALARLRLKVCVPGNCTIELKEVGKGNETVPAYEVEVETEGKFLGLFKTKAKVKTQVNAETGEIIRVKKPFLTSVKTED